MNDEGMSQINDKGISQMIDEGMSQQETITESGNRNEQAVSSYQSAREALSQGDLIGGIASLSMALKFAENYAEARLLRAQTLLKMGDMNGAAADAQWLKEHNDGWEGKLEVQEDVLLLLGQLAYAKGDSAEALHIYNKVLELNPQRFKDVSGDYTAKGVEQMRKRTNSLLNPFGV